MASPRQGDCPERASQTPGESKGSRKPRTCLNGSDDDGIVVRACGICTSFVARMDSLYVGETGDVELRLAQHNEGSASAFTAKRRPIVLVSSEMHVTRADALKRERQIKGWTRAKKEALIAGDSALLKIL